MKAELSGRKEGSDSRFEITHRQPGTKSVNTKNRVLLAVVCSGWMEA